MVERSTTGSEGKKFHQFIPSTNLWAVNQIPAVEMQNCKNLAI